MTVKGFLATLAGIILFVGVCVGGWYLIWGLKKASVENNYDINTHTQQYDSAVISQERDRAAAIDAAQDPGLKANLTSTFCAVYTEIKQPTPDLVQDHVRLCLAG